MSVLTPSYVFAWKLTPAESGLSGGNPFAGWVVSPSRSRTMLLYSTREMRRSGDQSTLIVPGEHDAAKRFTPIAVGAEDATATVPASVVTAEPSPDSGK